MQNVRCVALFPAKLSVHANLAFSGDFQPESSAAEHFRFPTSPATSMSSLSTFFAFSFSGAFHPAHFRPLNQRCNILVIFSADVFSAFQPSKQCTVAQALRLNSLAEPERALYGRACCDARRPVSAQDETRVVLVSCALRIDSASDCRA